MIAQRNAFRSGRRYGRRYVLRSGEGCSLGLLEFLGIERTTAPPLLPAPRLMPQAGLQFEVIPVIEDDPLGCSPIRFFTDTDAAQVLVIVGQAVAARVIPVMPQRA